MRLTPHVAFLACLSLSSHAAAEHADALIHRRHGGIAKRAVEKRGGGARYSFYDITTGEVACGGFYQPNDFVVALNSAQFGSGGNCGKEITMSYNGKTTQAKIVDECPGCPDDGLDLTEGLFSFFASKDLGIIYGEWSFGGAAAPPPKPATTSKPPPPPPTSHKPTPTSTPPPPPPPPTTSKKPKTTSTTSTTTSTPTPSSTSTSVVPTTTTVLDPLPVSLGLANLLPQSAVLDGTQNLLAINSALLSLGALVKLA